MIREANSEISLDAEAQEDGDGDDAGDAHPIDAHDSLAFGQSPSSPPSSDGSESTSDNDSDSHDSGSSLSSGRSSPLLNSDDDSDDDNMGPPLEAAGHPVPDQVAGEIEMEDPRLSQAAFPGSLHTLKQFLLLILKVAMDNKFSLQALEDLLKTLAFLLPRPNHIPPTKYLLFTLLDINVDKYERHICVSDCHVFPVLHPSEYLQNELDACPRCGKLRFKRKGATLSPVKKFYAIPLREQIAMLKKNPDFDLSTTKLWHELQQEGTTFYDSFWMGSLAAPFLEKMEGEVENFAKILVFSLGLDGVQVFGHGHYEVWPVGLRLWNLHPQERGKQDFILLAALIPGPRAPELISPYLQPLLEEIVQAQQGVPVYNATREAVENLQFHIATTQQDMPAMAKSTEHIGPSGRCNCHRCQRRSEPNPDTNHGAYQGGYANNTAFSAQRRTNEEARAQSQLVAQGEIESTVYGIKKPSLLATFLPNLDIVYGHMIEFFHDLQINCPKTFWKDFIFKKPKRGVPLPAYSMTIENRRKFAAKIASVKGTHDLPTRLKDPSSGKMKAIHWHVFIVTTSVWAAEGLLSQGVMETWCHFRNGYMAYLEGPLTPEKRAFAKNEFRAYGRGIQRELGITACTISNHMVIVEADSQIPVTGPIRESMGSWVERLMFSLLEHTRRKRITTVPEKSMVTGYLLDQFVLSNKLNTPVLPQQERDRGLRDDDNEEPYFLGVGKVYTLTPEERGWLRVFALNYELGDDIEIPNRVLLFKRAQFRTELHSEQYTAVRSRASFWVAITFQMGDLPQTYFGKVHKFFKVVLGGNVYRLALNTTYANRNPSRHGVPRIALNQPYASGKLVVVNSISRKVIVTPATQENPTSVLEIPLRSASLGYD